MALVPYTQQIAVKAGRGVIQADLPVVRDDNGAIANLGASFFASQEPRFKQQAVDAAEKQASTIALGVDANGVPTRPDGPKGGGIIFREAFDRLLDNRYVDTVTREQEIAFNDITAQNRLNPQGALEMMTARSTGVLKAVPDHLKAQVESVLLREVAQRHGQVVGETTRHMASLLDEGNVGIIREGKPALLQLITNHAPAEQIAALRAKIATAYRDRVATHEMTQGNADVSELGLGLDVAQGEKEVASLDGAAAFAPLIDGMTMPQLQTVGKWATGRGLDETIVMGDQTLTRDEFFAQIPLPQDRLHVAGVAQNEYGARDQAVQRAEQAQRQAAADAQAQADAVGKAQLAADHANGARTGAQVMDSAAKDTLDEEFAGRYPGLTPRQIYTAPGGKQAFLAAAQDGNGWIPSPMLAWMNTGIMGEDAGLVRDAYHNLSGLHNSQGVPIGPMIEDKLEPRTKALLGALEASARAGIPENVAIRQLIPLISRNSASPLSIDEIKPAFIQWKDPADHNKGVMHSYDSRRDGVIRLNLGLDPTNTSVPLPRAITRDFDFLAVENMQIHGGDARATLAATGAQVRNGWAALSFFKTGVGPRIFANRQLTAADLDHIVGAQKGASFANGPGRGQYLRLDPLDDFVDVDRNGKPMFGKFMLRLYNSNGQELPPAVVDMDTLFAQYHQRADGRLQAAQAAERTRLINTARTTAQTSARTLANRVRLERRTVGSGPKM